MPRRDRMHHPGGEITPVQEMPGGFRVAVGQVYASCRPHAPMIFIVQRVENERAYVVDPFGGRTLYGRHFWVALSSLHLGKTAAGKERRSGFRLYTLAPDNWGQYLCGGCLTYFEPGDLAVPAAGPAAACCFPCKERIEAMVAEEFGAVAGGVGA